MPRNIFFATAIAILLFGILGGCASPQFDYKTEASKRIANGEWTKAYDSIEIALGSDEARTRLWGYDLLVANPALRLAATDSFSEEAVRRAFALHDPVTANEIETYRLSLYAKYASAQEVEAATNNIRRAFSVANAPRLAILEARRASGTSLLVTDYVLDQLSPEDKEKLRKLYPEMRPIARDGIGKIVSSQILDKSLPGSSSGSQLGAAFGQAAYIDRSFAGGNYSAVGQLGAGLIGAVLGSSLNRNPEQRFLINYGVQLGDGTVKGVAISSSDGVASPVGQCVFMADAQEAPGYLCADTLVAFLERASTLTRNAGDAARRPNKAGVKCKLSLATLTLANEECQRLNGVVVAN